MLLHASSLLPAGFKIVFFYDTVCVFKSLFWYTSLTDAMTRCDDCPRVGCGSPSCMSGGGLLLRLPGNCHPNGCPLVTDLVFFF